MIPAAPFIKADWIESHPKEEGNAKR